MQPYSNDLRQRIVAVVDRGIFSLAQVADLFAVAVSTIVRLLQRRRQTGSFLPKPHAGGPPPKLNAADQVRLLALVHDQPDATLAELRQRLGCSCSLMTLARALKRQRITRKKKTLHAQEQDSEDVQRQRVAFTERLAGVDPQHLVFVDEMGATTALTRLYGRSPAGERVAGAVPGGWQNVTLIAGLRPSGVLATVAFPGAVDQALFGTYVQEVLVPELRPGDVVVWDRLSAHREAAAQAAVEAVGARLEWLPSYSPDESPIEEMFGKVKATLRRLGARTVDTVTTALGVALNGVTLKDIAGWFGDRCSYATRL
jgi:transposase